MNYELFSAVPNEVIWLFFALINFVGIAIFYKLYGKTGLLVWIGFGTVLANIQVVKQIEMFGMHATLGNIMYGTLFLATDSISEKYGIKEAKKAVGLGFLTLLFSVIIIQVALIFHPSTEDFAQEPMEILFGIMWRIALGSLVAYLVSQFFDVFFFQKIKHHFQGDQFLWLRNTGSTMVSQLIDTVIFVTIAFLGEVPMQVWFDILLTTYIIKVVVSLLDTPFIYLIKNIKPLYNE